MPVAKASTFEPAPEGTHVARCFGCVALGTQHSAQFADSFKVMLMFELPEHMIETEDGAKPAVVSKEYTLSIGPKSNLGKALESWRGRGFTKEEMKGFEISNVVGAPCQITVSHKTSAKGGVWADIIAIVGVPKNYKAPDQWHKSVKYEVEHGKNEVFLALPEWIQKKIGACEEWQPSTAKPTTAPEPPEGQPPEVDDDGVPF
jgi:hypothetical protein